LEESEESSMATYHDPPMVVASADKAQSISAVLLPTYNTLRGIKHQLLLLIPLAGKLNEIQESHFYWLSYQLNEIECTQKHEGVWMGSLVRYVIPTGQAWLQAELEGCHRIVHHITFQMESYWLKSTVLKVERQDEIRERRMWKEMKMIPPSLRPIYCQLVDFVTELSHSTGAHSLAAEATSWDRAKTIRSELHVLVQQWMISGVWIQPEYRSQWRKSGLAPSGQAILNKLVADVRERLHKIETSNVHSNSAEPLRNAST